MPISLVNTRMSHKNNLYIHDADIPDDLLIEEFIIVLIGFREIFRYQYLLFYNRTVFVFSVMLDV